MYFELSLSIIISKHNKVFYDFSKYFHPIILLNMLRKLIGEAIGKHLQFYSIANNFIHPIQLRRLKQWSTTDTGIFLTYLIYSG